MNWEPSETVEQESDKFKRWIKESICIRSNTPTKNRDKGAYQLPLIWTQVPPTQGGGGGVSRVTLPSEAYLRLLTPLTIFK